VHPLDSIAVWVPGQQSTCVPQAPTGVVFPCDEGVPRAGFRDDTNNFAPRLGFAYDLTRDGRTVVRGGYGLTYAFAIFNTLQEGQVGIPFAIRDVLVDLPFSKDSQGLAGVLLAGWQVNGIATFYSGLPVDVIGARDDNLDGRAADRPDLVGEWQTSRPSDDDIVAGATWFDTAAFAPPGVGQIGTFGRNVISGPDYKNVDLTLSKRFRLKGSHELQLRLEAYNVFNFTNFINPIGNTTSKDFGEITGVVAPRILQLGARYSF